jgi:pyruvate dehydrogenase E1 component alpha subunit
MRDASSGEAESTKLTTTKFSKLNANLRLIRVLSDDGRLLEGETSPLDIPQTRALYRQLVRARTLDLRFVELQRTGEIPFYATALGEEGATVAPVVALAAEDAFFPGPREALASSARGVSVLELVHHVLGSARSSTKGRVLPTHLSARAHSVVSVSGVAGAALPHATGFGWAARMKKSTRVALAVVSGGAFVTGDFHNALNFAGVSKANVVFVCRVDRDTALGAISATETVAEKAVAYGVPHSRVDGRDALAVWREVGRAIASARAGEGTTLVEIVTARALPSEDGTITLPEVACPIALLERHLVGLGEPVDALRPSIESELVGEYEAALAEARKAGPPSRQTIFEDVYAEIPLHLRAQAEALR